VWLGTASYLAGCCGYTSDWWETPSVSFDSIGAPLDRAGPVRYGVSRSPLRPIVERGWRELSGWSADGTVVVDGAAHRT
jgi:hypothetical protein